MEFNYGELIAIYQSLEKFKGNKTEVTFNNKNGEIDFEPVKITELMAKVKAYGNKLSEKYKFKVGKKVVPFQKTAKHWEEDFTEYINSKTDISLYLKEHGYLYIVGFDKSEKAYILGISTDEEDGGDYFNSDDFKPYEEN